MMKLIIFAGVPASGKTSQANKLKEQGFSKLCADDIRQEIYGNAATQGDNAEVYKVFYERLNDLLNEGRDLIIDNTNILIEHRAPIIEEAKKAGYEEIEIWLFDVPLEVCLERNRLRQRIVPEEIIRAMHNDLFGEHRPQPVEAKVVLVA